MLRALTIRTFLLPSSSHFRFKSSSPGLPAFLSTKPMSKSGDPRLGTLIQVLPSAHPSPEVESKCQEAGAGCEVSSADERVCQHCNRSFSRISDLQALGRSVDVVLVGFPFSEGAVRNGGRDGASAGPDFFRRMYPGMGALHNPEHGIDLQDHLTVVDWGDIPKSDVFEDAHKRLRADIADIIKAGSIPFVIGGSNDQSYSNAAGFMDALGNGNIGVVNIDAHLDVRPLLQPGDRLHSGSPFRQLLEDPRFHTEGGQAADTSGRFFEYAVQGHQCSAEHVAYARSKGTQFYWLTKDLRKPGADPIQIFRELLLTKENFFVSFDLDSVCSSHASAVSCPGNIGLTAEEAIRISYEAGRCPNVKLFDLSEFNPLVGDAHVTSRLIVTMFYHFLLGLAERKRDAAGGKK